MTVTLSSKGQLTNLSQDKDLIITLKNIIQTYGECTRLFYLKICSQQRINHKGERTARKTCQVIFDIDIHISVFGKRNQCKVNKSHTGY